MTKTHFFMLQDYYREKPYYLEFPLLIYYKLKL